MNVWVVSCSLKTLLIIYNPNANTNNDYSDGNNDKSVTKNHDHLYNLNTNLNSVDFLGDIHTLGLLFHKQQYRSAGHN